MVRPVTVLLLGSLAALAFGATITRTKVDVDAPFPTTYTTAYFAQVRDHFNQAEWGDSTFQQRYLLNSHYVEASSQDPPIFFYSGNEGPIDQFYGASGYILELAYIHKALVIFAEHRFYGESAPFGDDSFQWPQIGLLTVSQATADYANLLTQYKQDNAQFAKSPIITFGGSYGGMLSFYLRSHYPNVFTGALAASAPVKLASSVDAQKTFWPVATYDYLQYSKEAVQKVQTAFAQVNDLAKQGNFAEISSQFNLCDVIKDDQDYIQFLYMVRNAFVTFTMFDYPYAANFGVELPAWPVMYSADLINNAPTPMNGLYQATALGYNGTQGNLQCLDQYELYVFCADPTGCGLGNDAKAWDFQACYEISLSFGTNNKTDMFPNLPWTTEMKDTYCKKTWNTTGRFEFFEKQYWGGDVWAATDVIFSNGLLDPWHEGGILNSDVAAVPTVILEKGAHHLDLRSSNKADPEQVTEARAEEAVVINDILVRYYANLNA
jgi:dipeptidyl-peptidase-2